MSRKDRKWVMLLSRSDMTINQNGCPMKEKINLAVGSAPSLSP